jgi:mannitol-1-phosphate 5-dehydrogenase
MRGGGEGRDPLSVVVEEHFQLVADRRGFVGEPPAIGGMLLADDLDAYAEQKLFTLNTAHAIAAYLGYLKGYGFIHEAIRDPEIRRVVSGALQECSAVLIKRHNFDPAEQERYAAGVLKRFENVALQDPVVRVAREPRRKLGPTDRLVKPAVLALESGVTPTYLATGIAVALLYDYPGDKQATALSRDLKEKGVDRMLNEVCDLAPDSALTELVKERMVEVRTRRDA